MDKTPLAVKIIFFSLVLIASGFAAGHRIGESAAVESAYTSGIVAGAHGMLKVANQMREGKLPQTLTQEDFYRAIIDAADKQPRK